MNKTEFERAGFSWTTTKVFPGPHSRFSDDLLEATMLHAKAVPVHYTAGWEEACSHGYKGPLLCDIGVPFPDDTGGHNRSLKGGDKGWAFNCQANKRINNFWIPKLTTSQEGFVDKNLE